MNRLREVIAILLLAACCAALWFVPAPPALAVPDGEAVRARVLSVDDSLLETHGFLRFGTQRLDVELLAGPMKGQTFHAANELRAQLELDKLFKPYEKGNKGKFGLGLSIVKKVVETYGYNVTGENLNDGVVFRIYTTRKMKKAPKKKNSKKSIIEA